MYCLSIFFMRGRKAINIIIAAPPKRMASTHIGVMLSSAVFKITNELPHISVVHMRQMRPRAALFWFFIALYLYHVQCGRAEHELFNRAAVKFNFYQIIISHRRHFHELAITEGFMAHPVADGKLRLFGRLGLWRGRRRNGLFEALLRARKANSFCTCDFSEYP